MEFLVEEEEHHDTGGDPRVHMLAGACAGLIEHCGMFPIDTIKTHQMLAGSRESMLSTMRTIVARNGFLGLFRGLPLVVAGSVPVHGISFSIYEFCKHITGANQPGHHFLASSTSGIVATLVHDACLVPIDTIKQRLQFSAVPYRGVWDCFTRVWRVDGVFGFYRGYTTTAVMNLPYAGIYYGAYESMKKLIKRVNPSSSSSSSSSSTLSSSSHSCTSPSHSSSSSHTNSDTIAHMLAGAAGGCLAGGITNPLDVVKTNLQVGRDAGKDYRGMWSTMRRIRETEGWRGFTKGIRPRMTFHSLSAAISWTTYEYAKLTLERSSLLGASSSSSPSPSSSPSSSSSTNRSSSAE